MLSKGEIYQIIDFILSETNGRETRVIVQSWTEGLTRFANSEIHQNVYEDVTEFTITIAEGSKSIEVATTAYDEDSLRLVIESAIQNLGFLPEGEASAPLVENPLVIESDRFSSELETLYTVENRARLIKECIATLESEYLAYGALTYREEQIAFGNSKGVKRFARNNRVKFTALISGQSGGSGFAEITSPRPQGFDVREAFARAYKKAVLNKNPIDIPPGAYTVILEPLAVGDLATRMALLGFTGKGVQNQASFLTGKLGEQVFDNRVNIMDNYTDENTLSLPFDFDGAERTVVDLIRNGVVRGFTYDGASAMKAGVPTTGHSVNMPRFGGIAANLVMAGGDKTLEQIISETDEALLVTRFHYMNAVNPRQGLLTALTRDGFFKVEKGEIVAAVKNMRFTESILQALNNVLEISSDRARTPFFFGNYYVPALKIKDFRFTGKTEA